MTSKSNEKQISSEEFSACTDGKSCHWIISPPNGPTSTGTCKKCGVERVFRNSFEYNTWHGEKPVGNKKSVGKNKADSGSDNSSK